MLVAGCGNTQPVSKYGFVLDTFISLTVYEAEGGVEKDAVLEDAMSLISDYEKLFSATLPDSDIFKVNAAGGEEAAVSEETYHLIEESLHYSALSRGSFDITTYPVSKLWNFNHRDEKDTTIPSDKDIQEALKHVGYEKIRMREENGRYLVSLSDPEAQIDRGGIAKGYIADQCKRFLKEKGVKSAIINLGGNVLLLGSKFGSAPFKVGIQKPFSEVGEVLTTIEETDRSVVSSGSYERYFESGGKVYHHIIDPKTGYPAESSLRGVTVVSDTSVEGDALSTTFFVLGIDESKKLMEELPEQLKVYFVDEKNEVTSYVNASSLAG